MLEFNEDRMNDVQKKLETQLHQDFVDECEQKLESISLNLEKIADKKGKEQDNLLAIIGDAHSMKGMGSSFGFPAVTVIAHRLEDFLSHRETIDLETIKNTYVFIDKINAILKLKTQPDSDAIAEIARTLPAHSTTQVTTQKSKLIEVLSVMPKSLQKRLINEELSACGFRVSSLHSSFDALNIAFNTKPDLIVVSAIIDVITGVELSNMLRALNSMEDIPIIVVTSFDERTLPNEVLPEKTAIARKGEDFAEDLSKCLIELGIMG